MKQGAINGAQHGAKSLLGGPACDHCTTDGVQNLPARVHQASGNFRAADINSQYEFGRVSGGRAILQRFISSL
jgi:hypothetical protein